MAGKSASEVTVVKEAPSSIAEDCITLTVSKDQPIGIIRAELNAAEVGKNAVCGELSICLQFADSAVNRLHR